MKRLRSGEISQVETNPFHTLVYKTNHVVKAAEWKDILSRAYVRYTVTLSLYIHIDPTELTLIFFSIQFHGQLRMDRLVFDASTECMQARHAR